MTQLSNVKKCTNHGKTGVDSCMYDSFIDTTLEDLF